MKRVIDGLKLLISDMETNQRSQYLAELEPITQRIAEKEMKLALIGNFNSGKSTFVNAMLRRSLLAVADMPTTAIPTYIDWKSSNNSTHIVLTDKDGEHHQLNDHGRAWVQKETGKDLPQNEGELIDYLTTSNELQSIIQTVHISYPQENGHPGFCIIDTPGINPGAEETAYHVIQTQNVLRQEADAAIVLFPCYNVYTRAFREFLEDNASHLMENSIFIVTKMDQVPTEQERKKLIRFVKAHLQNDFGLDEPEVYGCSAGCALRAYEDDKSVTIADYNWKCDFEQMITKVFSSLEGRRLHVVKERANSMIEMLIHDINGNIVKRRNELYEIAEKLSRYSYDNLEYQYRRMLDNYISRSRENCEYNAQRIEKDIHDLLSRTKAEVTHGIQIAHGILGLSYFVKGRAKEIMHECDASLHSLLKSAIQMVINKQKKDYYFFVDSVDSLLREYQMRVGSIHSVSGEFNNSVILPESVPDINIDVRATELLDAGGIIAFSLITSGGFWGILLGLLANAILPVDSKKRQISQKIEYQIEKARTASISQVRQITFTYRDECASNATELLDAYRAAYKTQFERMLQEYEEYKRQIEAELLKMEDMLRQLQQIKLDFENIKAIEREKRILITGEVRTGKSSLINYLVDESVFPTSIFAGNGIPISLKYGEKGLDIYPRQGGSYTTSEPYRIYPSTLSECFPDIDDNLLIHDEQGKDVVVNASDIGKLIIHYPLSRLENGLVLTEVSSYLKTEWPAWYTVSKDFFSESHVFIYLMNAQRAFTRLDRDILQELNELGIRNIIIAFTFWDTICSHYASDRVAGLKATLKTMAEKYTDLGENGIFYLDLPTGIKAKQVGDEHLLKASGMLDLERFIHLKYKA